ncbi:MAG: SMC-Scp complex subunit ScpB [archaeon]
MEALLFLLAKPTSLDEISKTLKIKKDEVSDLCKQLSKEYLEKDSALEVIFLDENTVCMRVKPEYMTYFDNLAIKGELSKAVLKTLGLIAVKSPVKQSLVVKIIGNKAYDYIKELEEKGFIKKEKLGNTCVLEVTKKFEQYFGKSVQDFKTKM